MKILITGGGGFVGSALINKFVDHGHEVIALTRKKEKLINSNLKQILFSLEDIRSLPDEIFFGVDCVIHTAARAHVMTDTIVSPILEYTRNNCDATLELADIAARAGVKRFVFISTIKVNGEFTKNGELFRAHDLCIPSDPYAVSKCLAEKGLRKCASKADMEIVIVRPPLIYGPMVRGNFASMISWVRKELPLPFGSVKNKRSLLAIDNLIDFIFLCADRDRSPKAVNQVFLISDGEDVSTSTLLRKVADAYGVKSLLLPVPVSFMRFVVKVIGKGDLANRLFGNLQVDSSKARKLLGWTPVVTMDEQLNTMAEFDRIKV